MDLIDPLAVFDWANLYRDYDKLCSRFSSSADCLSYFSGPPACDRALYYALVTRVPEEAHSSDGITIECYEAMLYWKLYSQPAALANICKRLRENRPLRESVRGALRTVSKALPLTTQRDSSLIVDLVRKLSEYNIWGMRLPTALPVRTTFLHFLYPQVVPIFDKQVLLAVGVSEKDANHKVKWLERYILHAWALAEKHTIGRPGLERETSVRLVDMALWVARGGCGELPRRLRQRPESTQGV